MHNAQCTIFAISEGRRSLLIMPSEAIFSINERNRNLFIFPSEEKILLKKKSRPKGVMYNAQLENAQFIIHSV